MRYALILTMIAVLALGACTAAETDSTQDTPDAADTPDTDGDGLPDGMNDGAAGTVPEGSDNAGDFDDTSGPDVVIDMVGGDWYFEVDGERNPTITVQEGDVVRINFESVDGFHDVVIDEFNAASEQVRTGGETFVEFIATQAGTFDYYCSVGNHRERGMVGQLVVE